MVKLPDDITFEDAALFGCAVITGVGAVTNTAKVQPGADPSPYSGWVASA